MVPGLDVDAMRLLAGRYEPISAPDGAILFQPGQACERLVLLTEGLVRVRMVSESGREIELYRVHPGETCVMSIACMMGERPYQAEGIADGPIQGVAISRGLFREMLGASVAPSRGWPHGFCNAPARRMRLPRPTRSSPSTLAPRVRS
jgi:CRP/FNR family transcriptional regulator